MSQPVIALIGATGRTGRPLIRSLLRSGGRVRALSRDPRRIPEGMEGVDVRAADLQHPDALVAAFQGATAIHYIPPSLEPRDPEFMTGIIAAADRAGVSRLVYHSVLHPGTPEMPHHIRKSETERQLRQSALRWTILQPAMYAQTALAFFDRPAGLLMPAFDIHRPFTPIHEGDLADAAAIVHTTPGHEYATYELAGSETLDFAAMGIRLAEILAQPVTTRAVAAETLAAHVATARGYTPDQVRELKLMFAYYDRHGLVGNGAVSRMILGREPVDFRAAARASLAEEAA